MAEKEADKQNIRQIADNEIQQLNDDLKKMYQETESLRQEKVNRVHVVLRKTIYFYSLKKLFPLGTLISAVRATFCSSLFPVVHLQQTPLDWQACDARNECHHFNLRF